MASSAYITCGQKTGITTDAVQLSSTPISCTDVLVQADPSNTTNLLIGDSNGQFISLTPGTPITISVKDLSKIWLKMASGAGIANWLMRE